MESILDLFKVKQPSYIDIKWDKFLTDLKNKTNTMFLDDELLKMAKEASIENLREINELSTNIYNKCFDYYQSRMHPNITALELKQLLDRTFNLFDSFVRMALKEKGRISIIAEGWKEYTFKDHFLSDEKRAAIYEKLK